MRRLITLTGITAAALTLPATAALASTSTSSEVGSPSQSASCIAAFTDYIAHTNPDTGTPEHGVGAIMSNYATSAPQTVSSFNVSINQLHGSLDYCLANEPPTDQP